MTSLYEGRPGVDNIHIVFVNKIWWLCLILTSTTRFASDVGYRMAKRLIGLYKEYNFYEQ